MINDKNHSTPYQHSPTSTVIFLPVAAIWLLTSLGLDDARLASIGGVPNWFVFGLVGFASHYLLLLARFQIKKASGTLINGKLGWLTDSLLVIVASTTANLVLSIASNGRSIDLDLILVQLILLLVVLGFGNRLLDYQQKLSDLRSEQLRLLSKKQDASSGLLGVTEASVIRRTELENELKGIFAASQSLISENLWELSETVIRPLSHQIAKGEIASAETNHIVWKPSWKTLSTELANRAQLRPLTTAAATALIFLGLSVQVGNQQNLLEPDNSIDGVQVVTDTASLISFFSQLGFGVFVTWLSVFLGQRFLKSKKG